MFPGSWRRQCFVYVDLKLLSPNRMSVLGFCVTLLLIMFNDSVLKGFVSALSARGSEG